MLKNLNHRTLMLAVMVFTLLISPFTWAGTLNIGTISTSPVNEIRTFQPFANYLAGELADDGIEAIKVIISTDIYEMAALMKSGKVDLFIDSSVTAFAVNKLSGSQFMLRRWKKGRGQYRSAIFVKQESDIKDLADLKGKILAFEEPFSTSGYMLPALLLRRQGLELSPVSSIHDTPPADQIGYIMALDNETQAAWVERDRVQAAAMAEDDFNELAETALRPLRLLAVSAFIPYHVMSHRPGLEKRLVDRIKTILKAADGSEPGRSILTGFEGTARFDDIPVKLLADVLKFEPFIDQIIR